MGNDKNHVANVGIYLEMGEFGHEKIFGAILGKKPLNAKGMVQTYRAPGISRPWIRR